MYTSVITNYIKNTNKNNFKYLSIDSQFIINKQMFKNKVGRNVQYKSKYGLRVPKLFKFSNLNNSLAWNSNLKIWICTVSAIVDTIGIPIVNSINKGSEHDSKFLIQMLEKLFSIGIDTNKFKEKKKSKITIFGDKAYDSTSIRTFISNNNMNCIIDYNNRNTKNLNKIKKITEKEKGLYMKRTIIENSHAWTVKKDK